MQIVCGVGFPKHWPPLAIELFLFRFGNRLRDDPFWRPAYNWKHEPNPGPYTGEGRFFHLKRLAKANHPNSFEWHDWSERICRALCDNKWVGITGCGGSSKSTCCALYGFYFYVCDPSNSAVLCLSTSIDGSKRRFWREMSRFWWEVKQKYGEAAFGFGDVMSPRPMIYFKEKSEKGDKSLSDHSHFIGVVAVGKGEEDEGIKTLKGFHPKRMFVCADELDSIQKSIVDVCRINLQSGTDEFGFAGLGNATSRFDAHGELMQPVHGWQSLTPDTEEWDSIAGAKCLLLNGYKSPRVIDGDNAWKGIITKGDINRIIGHYGENSKYVWTMVIGLWAPDGVDNSVMPESLFIKFNAREKVIWRDSFTPCGLLDPAFGGDRCAYRRMDYGHDTDNNLKILFHPWEIIPISQNDSSNPAEYQIASAVQRLNAKHGIKPENFILDCTGTGRGTASVLQREYSPNILTCEFGGAASDLQVSDTNRKPCREEYDRRVTELYFSFAEFLKANMIRGLDSDTCREFSNRTFLIKGSGHGKRFSIESKADFKERGFPSPDLSDCSVLGADLLKRRNLLPKFDGSVQVKQKSNWLNLVRHFDLDSRKDAYAEA